MKRYNFSTKWTLLLLVLVVFSCSKEQIKTGGLSIFMPDQGVLVFEDFDDLIETMQATRQMDSAQLIAFEIERGYTSFGRVADDIYIAIIPQDTICFDSLQQYVQINSAFLFLEEDGEGWHTLEARFDMCPQYYIMNLNRMYIVGDTAYKLFEEGLLYTSTDNYLEMVGIDNEDLYLYIEDPDYVFLANAASGKKGSKDAQYNAGRHWVNRETNGRNRTYIRYELKNEGFNWRLNSWVYTNDGLVRPYYRIAGVWFWCNRTITTSFRCAIDYKDHSGNWQRNKINPTPIIKSNKATTLGVQLTATEWGIHYGGLDAWGKTPSTDFVRIQIDPHICY